MILKKLPDVVGFYMPGDRRDDFDGRVPDPKTGELVYQPSMTKQSFVAECDINNIVRDFTQHGMVTHINEKAQAGAFADLPDSVDYQEALEIARAGQTAFDELPAQVRKRFDNDPVKFLDFLQDPANLEETYELGLATRPPLPAQESAPPKAADQASDQVPPPAPPKA